MRQPIWIGFAGLIVVSLLTAGFSGAAVRGAGAQGANLLSNPGFEGTYLNVGEFENMRVAAGWAAWWHNGTKDQYDAGYLMKPEYKAAFDDEGAGSRTHTGHEAQQMFHSYANFQAGIFQGVSGVRPGQRLRFTLWQMAWSCEKYDRCHSQNPPAVWSWHPSDMHMRIGIDPYGGSDPFSANIVWSPEKNSFDAWDQWTVEAVAASNFITVWTYAYPDYRNQDNDVYMDDGTLTVVGAGSIPPQGNGGTATPPDSNAATPVPQPTSNPPSSDLGPGEQLYVVQEGDTLSAIGLRFGVSWHKIAERNDINNPDYIYVGQELIIPAP
jgi:hypothetical protein